MTILLTGGSGFIGSSLLHNQVFLDNNVYILSRSKKSNFKNVHFIQQDLSKKLSFKIKQNIDCIIHLAQSNNYRNFPEKADDIFKINTYATFNLLEWGRINKIKQFILASTGNVYQNNNKIHYEGEICIPEGFYATSKYSAELIAQNYVNYFNIKILRIFGAYGPSQKKMIIPNLIEKILTNSKISLAQKKGLVFNPIYIDDLIYYLNTLIKIQNKVNPDIYNIAGNDIIDLNQLCQILKHYLNKKIFIENTLEKEKYLIADITKIKKTTNYYPLISIIEGLKYVTDSL